MQMQQTPTPTRPLGTALPATQLGTTKAVLEADDDEVTETSGLLNILAIVGFIAALVVLGVQLMTANVWVNAEGNPKAGAWSQLIE
jgi:hypothetical protein